MSDPTAAAPDAARSPAAEPPVRLAEPHAPRPGVARAALAPRPARTAPLNVFLLVVALIWLVPTVGLLVASLRPAADNARAAGGRRSTDAAASSRSTTTAAARRRRDRAVVLEHGADHRAGDLAWCMVAALAGYAFAWLDFPGRDWFSWSSSRCSWCRSRWR